MKPYVFSLLIALIAAAAHAQTPTAGRIEYDVLRRPDPTQLRRPAGGDGDGAPGMPDVISYTQTLLFSGNMAKEERNRPQNQAGRRQQQSDQHQANRGNANPMGGMRQLMRGSNTYLDLANRKRIQLLPVRRDSTTELYRTDQAWPTPDPSWAAGSKTRKIAGYTCQKATATLKNVPYTVWYTTELPFTYSPMAELTPPKGVVLQIESDDNAYKASAVSLEAVDAASVQPPANAKTVTPDEMEQMRRKQMADFRQRMMQNGGNWQSRPNN